MRTYTHTHTHTHTQDTTHLLRGLNTEMKAQLLPLVLEVCRRGQPVECQQRLAFRCRHAVQCSNCGGGSVLASQLGQDIRRALHPGDGHISAPHLGVMGPDAPVVLAGRDSCDEGVVLVGDGGVEGVEGVVEVGDGGVDVVEGGVEVVELCAKAIHCGQGQERNDFDFRTDYTCVQTRASGSPGNPPHLLAHIRCGASWHLPRVPRPARFPCANSQEFIHGASLDVCCSFWANGGRGRGRSIQVNWLKGHVDG